MNGDADAGTPQNQFPASGFPNVGGTDFDFDFAIGQIRLGLSLGIPRISIRIPRVNIPRLAELVKILKIPVVFGSPTGGDQSPKQTPAAGILDHVVQRAVFNAHTGQTVFQEVGIAPPQDLQIGTTAKTGSSVLARAQAQADAIGKIKMERAARERGIRPPQLQKGIGLKKEGGMALDLGDLLGQLGTELIKAKFNPTGLGDMASSTFPENTTIPTTPAVGIPFVDVIPEAGANCGGQMLWKPATANCAGRWIKRSRRRRRRLLTASDAKDLAALKATVGPAIMKTWIATHPQ